MAVANEVCAHAHDTETRAHTNTRTCVQFALLRSTMLDLDGPATPQEVANEVHWDHHAANHGVNMVRSLRVTSPFLVVLSAREELRPTAACVRSGPTHESTKGLRWHPKVQTARQSQVDLTTTSLLICAGVHLELMRSSGYHWHGP
jgi:hypothetical protein